MATPGVVDLAAVSPHSLVPFEVHRLTGASIPWLNHRWWAANGVDLRDAQATSRLRAWLADQFAFAVLDPSQSQHFDRTHSHTFWADRYGTNTGYFAHGGSGRAAVLGQFNVKGVGATPLVGEGVNREHSHGCASLNVAIREAIYAEVFDLEFPFGAVPVVAIIDTGLTFESSARKGHFLRRALIVRPSVLRPAHFQRAPGFVRPVDGHHNSQLDDVKRTIELLHHFEQASSFDGDGTAGRLGTMLRKFATQAAFGQVHRLYSGGFFSSNLSVAGQLMDYGNAHAFPDWANAKVLDNDLGFGRELETIVSTARSLFFYFKKYALKPPTADQEAQIIDGVVNTYHAAFKAEMLRIWGLELRSEPSASDAVFDLTRTYYNNQQRRSLNYSRGAVSDLGWPHTVVNGDAGQAAHENERSVVEKVLAVIDGGGNSDRNATTGRAFAKACAARMLAPRTSLIRASLQKRVNAFLDGAPSLDQGLSALIAEVVSEGRRHWKSLPDDFAVEAHVHHQGSSALLGWRRDQEQPAVWVEGLRHSHRGLELFGCDLVFDAPVPEDGADPSTWHSFLPPECLSECSRRLLIAGQEIAVPGTWVRYDGKPAPPTS